jgi:hypothetical protein
LQAVADGAINDIQASIILYGQQLNWLNTRLTNLQVRFMNTADVTVVVTVLANFQVQIVLDL